MKTTSGFPLDQKSFPGLKQSDEFFALVFSRPNYWNNWQYRLSADDIASHCKENFQEMLKKLMNA